MAKTTYLCEACGHVAPSYLGRCPECQGWNTFTEQVSLKVKTENARSRVLSNAGLGNRAANPNPIQGSPTSPPAGLMRLSDVQMEKAALYSSGFAELDRVLGGGILPGSYVLIGGDPGIGKSTLMLQMASRIGKNPLASTVKSPTGQSNPVGSQNPDTAPILYVAGEESAYQVRLRAERLGADTTAITVLPATDIYTVVQAIQSALPKLVVIDSIQSMSCPDASGTPGSVSQIRECAAILMEAAKSLNVAIFLIGHVTKEGAVAGPKLLEHTVDAVLYFEGDKYQNLRVLRAVKNRFGNTQEIGVFEMAESGLREIDNPSALFLSNGASGLPGSVIAATMEGSRPLLVEIQALVGQSTYPSPRRVGNGIDHNRLHQIIAVLERRLGLDFSRQDIYANVVGGLRIDEPAVDLAVAIAIVSSARDLPVITGTAVTGEIGLTGEIRAVSQIDRRKREAARIGFTRLLTPKTSDEPVSDTLSHETPKQAVSRATQTLEKKRPAEIECIAVGTLAESVQSCFAPRDWAGGELDRFSLEAEEVPPARRPYTGSSIRAGFIRAHAQPEQMQPPDFDH